MKEELIIEECSKQEVKEIIARLLAEYLAISNKQISYTHSNKEKMQWLDKQATLTCLAKEAIYGKKHRIISD